MSPKKIRGTVIGGYQLAITIGLLLAACVNERTKNRNGTAAYRIPIVLQFAWALILATGLLLLPESSRFYVMKDQRVKAELALFQSLGPSSEFRIHPKGVQRAPMRILFMRQAIVSEREAGLIASKVVSARPGI